MNKAYPGLVHRLYAVWWRHVRVYAGNLFSNATPPFLEPLIFLMGIGLGLGHSLAPVDGQSYIQYLALGVIVISAMFTAAFENTFGTFIRMEFDKVYDGMIAASITAENLFVGEILFVATKGAFFAFASLVVLSIFGLVPTAATWLAILVGFFCAGMFACVSLFVTSFVKTINHFNFYFTLFISPLMFLSGVVFPTSMLPDFVRAITWALPLTHAVALVRDLSAGTFHLQTFLSIGYVVLFSGVFGVLGVKLLKRRLVN